MPASDQDVQAGARYQLIPRTLVFVTCKDRILLIKGASHKRLWAGRYNGIGGHVESGESILEAAQRELWEEAGISGVELILVGVVTVDTGQNPGVCIFVLRVDLSIEDKIIIKPELSSSEGMLEWVDLDHLWELPLVEDLEVLLPKALGTNPGEAPFSAAYSYDDRGSLLIRFS